MATKGSRDTGFKYLGGMGYGQKFVRNTRNFHLIALEKELEDLAMPIRALFDINKNTVKVSLERTPLVLEKGVCY